MKRIFVTALAAMAALSLGVSSQAATAADVLVKKAIADSMSPEQLAAYKATLAARINAGAFDHAKGGNSLTPGDTCTAATPEIGTLPFNSSSTTVGQVDNFDLPADTTAPTCTASTNCTGAPAGRGSIYTGTGTGPDNAYSLQVSANCDLVITMDPTGAQDLGLIVYQAACSSSLADCVCIDDTGVGGVAETVTVNAVTGLTYFAVTDGYSTGATPPGPSGPYTLNITTPGTCTLVPVELMEFSIGD